ncbi:MAG TPA: PDZ domain-containing protein [Fimbriimonadaceae bacterium]|nr:PDZ domain-containing protein [Fimbriimonadaceae bacterium]
MSFSVVSLVLALAQQQAVPVQDSAVWKTVRTSVVTIQNGGVAALIDDSGLFLAHASSVPGNQVKAKFFDGTQVTLIDVATDEQTQLTLLKATVWRQGTHNVVQVASTPATAKLELLAVTTDGPKSGEFVTDGLTGVMRPSLRYVPLSEIRLASSDDQLGGAMVFNASGELMGVLGATLSTDSDKKGSRSNALSGGGSAAEALKFGLDKFGPQGLTVAYALGREVLERVVDGFKSPTHKVDHPTIGIFFKATVDGKGVYIDTVMGGSPAANAGLEPGDVILEVDGEPVNNPVDLAVLLFRHNVGDVLSIKYMRGILKATTQVKVEGSQSTLGL